ILAGHCVGAPSNARLPKDMKIAAEKLERILSWLARRYRVTSVGAAWRELATGRGPSLVALSMDDGYRDNRTHLLPLLQRLGVEPTISLETRPLEERRVNWSHKLAWVIERLGSEEFLRRFQELCPDERVRAELEELVRRRRTLAYHVKRALKYRVPREQRDRAL